MLLHDKDGLSRNKKVTDFCENLYKNEVRSPFLLSLIVDMCEEQVSLGGTDSRYTLERAKDLCHDLANTHDTIRSKYWNYMYSTIEAKSAKSKDATAGSSTTD